MLILTRNIGQIIHIGDDITVTIRESEENQTSVEVDAPKMITVRRENVYYRTKTPTLEAPKALKQVSAISI